jgi:hypothetical protein
MIIPEYWAEARLQHRDRKRQVTMRRFGWSDIGQAEAQAHAEARVREAMDRALAGETLPRRERRVAYNGADGMPIREEIVDRAGDTVITRNGYGALCLNTPNVLFADIDHEAHSSPRRVLVSMILVFAVIAIVMIAGLHFSVVASLVVAFFASLLLGVPLPGALSRLSALLQGGHEQVTLRRIRQFMTRAKPRSRPASTHSASTRCTRGCASTRTVSARGSARSRGAWACSGCVRPIRRPGGGNMPSCRRVGSGSTCMSVRRRPTLPVVMSGRWATGRPIRMPMPCGSCTTCFAAPIRI